LSSGIVIGRGIKALTPHPFHSFVSAVDATRLVIGRYINAMTLYSSHPICICNFDDKWIQSVCAYLYFIIIHCGSFCIPFHSLMDVREYGNQSIIFYTNAMTQVFISFDMDTNAASALIAFYKFNATVSKAFVLWIKCGYHSSLTAFSKTITNKMTLRIPLSISFTIASVCPRNSPRHPILYLSSVE